jgi:hypothetical protein
MAFRDLLLHLPPITLPSKMVQRLPIFQENFLCHENILIRGG